jgi:hypothetical protein
MIINEQSARRLARRAGLALRKSRSRNPKDPGFGGYMLIDPSLNCAVAGADPFAFSLDFHGAAAELARRLPHCFGGLPGQYRGFGLRVFQAAPTN